MTVVGGCGAWSGGARASAGRCERSVTVGQQRATTECGRTTTRPIDTPTGSARQPCRQYEHRRTRERGGTTRERRREGFGGAVVESTSSCTASDDVSEQVSLVHRKTRFARLPNADPLRSTERVLQGVVPAARRRRARTLDTERSGLRARACRARSRRVRRRVRRSRCASRGSGSPRRVRASGARPPGRRE